MSILLRRALITVPPLVLAGVLLIHPNDEGDTIYESVRPVVDNWILVHIALLLAFPFLLLAAFMLLGGLRGRAATVARLALVFFAVIYTAWEVMVGLSTGILTDYANGLPAGERRLAVDEGVLRNRTRLPVSSAFWPRHSPAEFVAPWSTASPLHAPEAA